DEERCTHPERDVERRDEAKVGPIGALEDKPVAECPSERVGRDKDPLRAGAMGGAETSQLGDEWIHATSLRSAVSLSGVLSRVCLARRACQFWRSFGHLSASRFAHKLSIGSADRAGHTLDVRPNGEIPGGVDQYACPIPLHVPPRPVS